MAWTHLITAQWKPEAHQHFTKTLAAFNAPRLHTHTHTHAGEERKEERSKRGGRSSEMEGNFLIPFARKRLRRARSGICERK